MSSRHVPIVISGGGSVGLSLAAELGWRGVECLVVERMPALNEHPRANAVANRTMEYFRRWGIDEAISKAGVPPDLPANYYYITTLAGRILHGINLPPFRELEKAVSAGGYAKDEHSWSPYLKTITGQHEVERAILAYVRQRQSVTFSFNRELVDFEQTDTNVICRIADGENGGEEEVTCDYLIACDGGRSMVRRKLGIGLSGRSDLAKFVSFYFRAPDLMNKHAFGHANIFFPCHRDQRGFLLNWDGGTTFTYHVILEEEQAWEAVDPIAAIEGVLGATIDIEILSVQPWTAHALTADRYSDGRVFLAGDAAHLFSPTGGFGMNTGVSDVIDLAWRLQASLDGWAGPHLLQSYETERRPVGIRNTMEAADCFDRLFAVMQEGDVLDDDGEAGAAARTRLKSKIVEQEKLIVSSGTLLGYRYEGSPIIVPDGTPEPPDHPRHYVATARPGHRAPHCWLEDGSSLLDRFSEGFTLLVMGPALGDIEKAAAPFVDVARHKGVPLTVAALTEPAAYQLYETPLALIRPDLMVAWRGGSEAVDADAILDIVRGCRK